MSYPGQPQQGQQNDQNPILTYYQEWRDKTPYVTRSSLIGLIGIWILTWFFDADRMLGNIPEFTIMHFEGATSNFKV